MKKLFLLILVTLTFKIQAQENKWTLRACVDYALEHNISIKQSELDLNQSEINKKDAFGNFLPSVNASSSQTLSIGLQQDPVTFDAVNATTRNFTIGVGSSISLYEGLRKINQMHRAKLEILASQYRLDKMKDDISLFVANSFLQILFNKEQLNVLQSQQNVSNQEYERTKDLVDAGALPKGDLLEIQATLATQQQQIVNAENSLLISKIQLDF